MKLIILIMVACVPSFGEQINTSDSAFEPQKALALSPDLILLDHWFFKGHSDKCRDLERAEPNIIKIGECFGFGLSFYTTRPTLKIHMEFRMPGVPGVTLLIIYIKTREIRQDQKKSVSQWREFKLKLISLLSLISSFTLALVFPSWTFGNFSHIDISLKSADAKFFIVSKQDRNNKFIFTDRVPAIPGQDYGWQIKLQTVTNSLRIKQVFTLPTAPSVWGEEVEGVIRSISNNGRTSTMEWIENFPNEVISQVWTFAEGDPLGDYDIQVFIEDDLVKTFHFKVVEKAKPQRKSWPFKRES